MKITQLLLADYMSVFKGNIHNYGQHYYNFGESKKEKGKNTTVTDKLLTIVEYKKHLAGEIGLGLIPINSNNKINFAVIDIDSYNDNLKIFIDAIEANNFPLIPFSSKSGGLHLYLFLEHEVVAKAVIDILNRMVQLLSLDLFMKKEENRIIEIFPKQNILQKGSIGNWINLPYFNYENTKQYCIRNNKHLNLDETLIYIKEKRTNLNEVKEFINNLLYSDGPPCLQSLYFLSPLEENSARNNYLFSFGIYLKKKDESFFEQELYKINNTLKNPLSNSELENTILSSLRKKDYSYMCTQAPLINYCRKGTCKKREFGVGKESGYFSELDYGQLKQIKTYDPYYEWQVKLQNDTEFKILRFKNEDEIIKQDTFLKLCFRELHFLPIKLKATEWTKIVNQHLIDLKIIDINDEEDTSPMSLFKAYFYDFLINRAMAQNKEQILNKRVYYDELDRVYYFRAKDLLEFIYTIKNFRFFIPTEIHGILQDLNCYSIRIRTKSQKQFRVYAIKVKDVPIYSAIDDEQVKDNENIFKPDFTKYDEEAF